jgi:triphosphatase
MAEEIELKLRMPPSQLQKLRRHPLIRALAQGKASNDRLVSTYFDTPDFRLRERRIALRIREKGDRRIQTLKVPPGGLCAASGGTANGAAGQDGAQHHLEFETDVTGDKPDLDAISDEGIRSVLTEKGVGDQLEPAFTTKIDRRTLPLLMADSRIELALDEGSIVANGKSLPIAEAELELLSGQPERLYEIALLLNETLPLIIERETKAARGYKLYQGQVPEPVTAIKPKFHKEMSVAEGFSAAARACLAHMRANEAAVLHGEDPEGVHQLRVAVRRLRALVSMFKGYLEGEAADYLAEELRWLQRSLGDARDLDVFLEETLAPLQRRMPNDEGLRGLAATATALRHDAYAHAGEVLHDPRYTRFLLRVHLWLANGAWFSESGPEGRGPAKLSLILHASHLLRRRARKLKKLGRRHATMSEMEMHEVRIAAKKLRYGVDFFRDIFHLGAVKAYLSHLKDLQELLGTLNDAVIGERLLAMIDARLGRAKQRASSRTAAGIVLGWQAGRIEQSLKHFALAWEDYETAKAFWKSPAKRKA